MTTASLLRCDATERFVIGGVILCHEQIEFHAFLTVTIGAHRRLMFLRFSGSQLTNCLFI